MLHVATQAEKRLKTLVLKLREGWLLIQCSLMRMIFDEGGFVLGIFTTMLSGRLKAE